MTDRESIVAVVILFLLLASPAVATGPEGPADTPGDDPPRAVATQPRIVAVVPNPAAESDAGERVVVEFPSPTNASGWTVDDGESAAGLPNRTLSGRVVLTTDPDAVPPPAAPASQANTVTVTVVGLAGHLALANGGETVELRDAEGRTVDGVTYEEAPEGKRYALDDDGWAWRIPGTTDLPIAVARDVPARTFVLPDAPQVPVGTVAGARERVLLAAYTFASARVADELCAARERGVEVAVLVEGDPVGGTTVRSARVLDRLVACGVAVSALGGPGDRYGVHHPKYAVVDDRALVLSENWKPAGTGGRSSRGWGVLLDSPRVADALARTFEADAGYRDARPWRRVRSGVEPVEKPPANGGFPGQFAPRRVDVDRVEVVVAPDNAEGAVVGLLDGAERSIRIQQVAIGSREHPFVVATVRAARRGVPVSVLLSGAWYVREDNQALVEWLNGLARREDLPIEARLVRPRSRFEKTHVKGVIVDGEAAVVGSLNWNAHATRKNREVVVVLHDREAAAYYGRVFRADWRGGVWWLPIGVVAVVGLAVAAATLQTGRTVRFEDAAGRGGTVRPDEPSGGDPW